MWMIGPDGRPGQPDILAGIIDALGEGLHHHILGKRQQYAGKAQRWQALASSKICRLRQMGANLLLVKACRPRTGEFHQRMRDSVASVMADGRDEPHAGHFPDTRSTLRRPAAGLAALRAGPAPPRRAFAAVSGRGAADCREA